MSYLVANNISHYFFQEDCVLPIIDNLSFSIERGEFISLLGPSGCGKTTLLSIISGLLTPTEGSIQREENIGYMLQQDFLFPWKTIADNCALGLHLHKKFTPAAQHEISRLLSEVGLANTETLYPNQLSGGMRQRAAFVRTLITNPQLLLLDEPFSALDYQNKLKLEDIVFQLLKNSDKTSVLVTHDIEEAIAMSDRIFLLGSKPSTIQRVIEVPEEIRQLPPLDARKHPLFTVLLEEIWKELSDYESRKN